MSEHEEAVKLVHAVISCQRCLHDLEQLKHTRYYDKEAKKKINLALKELMRREGVFDGFLEVEEENAEAVHDTFFDFMSEVCRVRIPEMGELTKKIEQWRIDFYKK